MDARDAVYSLPHRAADDLGPAVLLTQTEADELHTALGVAIGSMRAEAQRLAASTWHHDRALAVVLLRHVGTLRAFMAALQEAHSI